MSIDPITTDSDGTPVVPQDRTFADAVSADVKRRASDEQTALITSDPARWLAGLHDILANLRGQEEKHDREVAVLQALTADGLDIPGERLEALETQRRRRDAFKGNVLRRLPDVEAIVAGPDAERFLAVPQPAGEVPVPARFGIEAPAKIQRRTSGSVWAAVFDSARSVPDEFVLVDIPLSKTSVVQLASDIRNAHRRSTPKPRLKSLRRDERWDAVWGFHDGAYKVWVKYRGDAAEAEALTA